MEDIHTPIPSLDLACTNTHTSSGVLLVNIVTYHRKLSDVKKLLKNCLKYFGANV